MLNFILDNSLLLLLIAGTSFTCVWLVRHGGELDIKLVSALPISVLHTVIGVACVTLFAMLESWDFSSGGAMSLFGAVFILPLFYWGGAKLFRRRTVTVFDVFTPCMVFTLLCARVNCLASGCCLGQYIPGLAPMRWPTREIELIFYAALMIWFIKHDAKREPPGAFYPLYMISYGAVRFVLEFFRTSDSPLIFHLSHLWAVICLSLGLSIYSELKKRAKKQGGAKK